jgi:hypothetical protein
LNRNEAYAELVARLDHDVNVEHQDYCIGEDKTRDLFERFRRNDPVRMDLTEAQVAIVEKTKKPESVGGYYYECPTCSKVTPIEPKPLVWFDVDRVDPEVAQQLMRGASVHAVPVIGNGEKIVGTVNRLPLPDRKCDHCGADGCSSCVSLAGLCPTCFENMLDGQAEIEGVKE